MEIVQWEWEVMGILIVFPQTSTRSTLSKVKPVQTDTQPDTTESIPRRIREWYNTESNLLDLFKV